MFDHEYTNAEPMADDVFARGDRRPNGGTCRSVRDSSDTLNVRLDGPRGSRIAWAIALLENPRCGVIRLGLRRRIVAANDRARDILRRREGITEEDGLLRAAWPEDDSRLQALLAEALPRSGGQGASGSTVIGRSASPPLVLHVCPIGPAGDLRQGSNAALVLAVDPAARGDIDARRVEALLRLTPAESGVAVALAEGRTVGEIALDTGRSETTVRWHLKQIFARHGISRQVDLVKLVLSVADIGGPPH